ncbi:MAG TPA: hypothetical protein VGH28_08330 [Polyangiaceae bacterium]
MKLLPLLDRPWVAPAIAAVAFGGLAVKNAASPAIDQDPFWLASAGRLVFATGHVPHENGFSFVAEHVPWICHELGFALLDDLGLRAIGPSFFALLGVAGAAATIGWVTAFVAREATHRVALAVFALLLLVGLPLFYSPPAFVSLGLVAAMTSLAFLPGFGWRRAVACALLEWAWAQFHGTFPLGVVILLVAAVEDPRSRRERLVAAGAGGLLTLVNPYGLALHRLVLAYAAGNDATARVIHEHITEFLPIWRAPEALGTFTTPALVAIGLLAIAALVRRDRIRGALVLALVALAVLQARHVLLALVVGSMLLARTLDALLPDTAEPRPHPRRVAFGVVAPGVLAALVAFGVTVSRHPSSWWLGKNLGGEGTPALVAELPNDAHVYAPFAVAPIVTWYAFPRGVRVLYDPRNDCYPAGVALAALSLEYDEDAERVSAAIVTRFGAEWALARTGSLVEGSFRAAPDWRAVDEKNGLALFTRR